MALDVEQLRAGVERRFAGQPGVVAVFLFGSHATDRSGPLSDVDVAVLADAGLGQKARREVHLDAIGWLLDLLPGADLDVIMLNEAPPALQYRVLRDGVLLLCRDREALVLFKAQATGMYFDFQPALDYREARILDRARRGELTRGQNPHRRAFEHHRRRLERPPTDAGDVR